MNYVNIAAWKWIGWAVEMETMEIARDFTNFYKTSEMTTDFLMKRVRVRNPVWMLDHRMWFIP